MGYQYCSYFCIFSVFFGPFVLLVTEGGELQDSPLQFVWVFFCLCPLESVTFCFRCIESLLFGACIWDSFCFLDWPFIFMKSLSFYSQICLASQLLCLTLIQLCQLPHGQCLHSAHMVLCFQPVLYLKCFSCKEPRAVSFFFCHIISAP